MKSAKRLAKRRLRRARHVRRRVRGSSARPRVSVHRSNKNVYVQIIDDEAGRTLCAASSLGLDMAHGGNVAAARTVGEALGKTAKELSIDRVGFDRGPYKYHGRVKALAEGLREAGLSF